MGLLEFSQKHAFSQEVEDAVDSLLYHLSNYQNEHSTQFIIEILEALYNGAEIFNEEELGSRVDAILSDILKGKQKDPKTIRAIYELADIKVYPIESTLRLGR
jgi:CRISPR/Cas system endoribonuclease Cas6 (RAMP superfamily)